MPPLEFKFCIGHASAMPSSRGCYRIIAHVGTVVRHSESKVRAVLEYGCFHAHHERTYCEASAAARLFCLEPTSSEIDICASESRCDEP